MSKRLNLHNADLLSRYDLGYFTERVFNTLNPATVYEHNWHIDCIAEYLRAVERGECKRLIINIPPRTLKTISVSVAFPAWLLGRNPSEQIVVGSYSKELSLDMSVKCRDVLRSDWYQRIFKDTRLKIDQDEKGKFMTDVGGQRFATSVGGTVTGMGGNFLILDDPVNPEEAQSEIERKSTNNWVRSTFMSRFNDDRKGRMVVVMQRLHADDVTGMFLEMGGWEHLCLPAQFGKKTIIQIGAKKWEKDVGAFLDEGRRNKEVLKQKMNDLGPLGYAAQYLQNPTPDDGAFFQKGWMKFYDKLPDNLRYYGASDFAVTSGGGDYTVHGILGVSPEDDWYLVDMWRSQEHSEVWANAQVDMIADYKPLEWYEEKGVIEKAVDPLVSKIMDERGVYCYRVKIASVKDKVTRAQALRGRMAAGRVYFPKNYPWVPDLMREVMQFPNSKHDDIVDMLSLFGLNAPNLKKGQIKIEKKQKGLLFKDAIAEHFRRCQEKRNELQA